MAEDAFARSAPSPVGGRPARSPSGASGRTSDPDGHVVTGTGTGTGTGAGRPSMSEHTAAGERRSPAGLPWPPPPGSSCRDRRPGPSGATSAELAALLPLPDCTDFVTAGASPAGHARRRHPRVIGRRRRRSGAVDLGRRRRRTAHRSGSCRPADRGRRHAPRSPAPGGAAGGHAVTAQLTAADGG